ncbi:MAG: aminomethyltransferase beta-barrel domain-containing protein, partial [Myxococcota bacterium]
FLGTRESDPTIPEEYAEEAELAQVGYPEFDLDAYRSGETPAPCANCNRTVKLVHLVELAERFGAAAIATGHYARFGDGVLRTGADQTKDQSYFLFGVPPAVLERVRFPLGGMTKHEVREHGRRLGVPNADKPDSQELCFVPDGDIAGFVRNERGEGRGGAILDEAGEELARHTGVEAFTIGQRKGLGLGGGGVRYVLKIVNDDVVVGERAGLMRRECEVGEVHWFSPPGETLRAQVRIRHRHRPAPAEVRVVEGRAIVRFDEPQRAVTPGQAAVFYDDERVLGGGFIRA